MNSTSPLHGALLIVLAGTGLGIGYNMLHPDPLPWKAEPKKTVVLVDPAEVETGGDNPGSEAAADPLTVPPREATTTKPPSDERPGEEKIPSNSPKEAAEPAANTASKEAATKGLYQDIPESEFPIEIYLAKTKEFYDRGGLLILDAREEIEYVEGHITGAVSAFADDMLGETDWIEATAKDPRPIMVYCGGGECDLSLNLGFEIARMGHRKVLIFMDGYPAWEEAGYPVETGEVP